MPQDPFAQYAVPVPSQDDPFAAYAAQERAPDFSVRVTPEDRSLGGFLGNVVKSGVEFGKNVATPFLHPRETIDGIVEAVKQPTLTARILGEAIKKRYGSMDAFIETAYTDPVGMASDLSMVLGGPTKLLALTGKAPRTAQALATTSKVLNPMTLPAKGVEKIGRMAYGAAINPSRRIRQGFPGAVDAGYTANVLPTEGGLGKAERLLEESAAYTRSRLAEADALGAPGVGMRQVAPAIAEVRPEATRRFQLGKVDERPDLTDRASALYRRNPVAVPNVEANKMKQTAQTLADSAFRAQERGALIKDLDAMADLKVAQALRKAIESNAASVGIRDIGQSNARTQSLIGLAQALEDATNQPSRLTHLMATLGGIGAGTVTGVPGGAAAYTAARVATAKPVMAAAGIATGKGGSAALRNAQMMRALAFLQAASQQEQPYGE